MAWLNGKRTVRCRKCWERGHNIRNCPQNSPEQQAAYADGVKARTCSYCGQPKHNKTSCGKRKDDMAEYAKRNGEYRQNILNTMRDKGFGIGALVTTDADNPTPECMYIITDIDWDAVQEKNNLARIFITQSITNGQYDMTLSIGGLGRYNWSGAYVLGRAKVEPEPPSDWLTGRSGIDKYFK